MPALSIHGVRCSVCEREHIAPQYVCRACGSDALAPVEVGGAGEIYAITTIHIPPDALRDEAPYLVGLIELDSGLRITARVRHARIPLRIGSPVQAVDEDSHGYIFASAPEAAAPNVASAVVQGSATMLET